MSPDTSRLRSTSTHSTSPLLRYAEPIQSKQACMCSRIEDTSKRHEAPWPGKMWAEHRSWRSKSGSAIVSGNWSSTGTWTRCGSSVAPMVCPCTSTSSETTDACVFWGRSPWHLRPRRCGRCAQSQSPGSVTDTLRSRAGEITYNVPFAPHMVASYLGVMSWVPSSVWRSRVRSRAH